MKNENMGNTGMMLEAIEIAGTYDDALGMMYSLFYANEWNYFLLSSCACGCRTITTMGKKEAQAWAKDVFPADAYEKIFQN